MTKFATIVLVLGVLSLTPLVAEAQTNAFIGPHVGFVKSSDGDDPNMFVGATLRLKLLPSITAEGDIGYRQEKFGSGAVTVKQWPVTVSGLLYVLPVLYGGLGAGWYNTTFDYSSTFNNAGFADETTQKFGWHLLAGLEIPASPGVHIFGDVRYVFLDYKFKNLPGAVFDGKEADFYTINAGLLFQI